MQLSDPLKTTAFVHCSWAYATCRVPTVPTESMKQVAQKWSNNG